MLLKIKPLSVNEAFQGRRFKTDKYKQYEKLCLLTLKPFTIPEGDLEIHFTFGFSSKLSDVDNPIKPILDILQKKYGFNDSRVFKITSEKEIVKKGSEFIDIKIMPYTRTPKC